MFRLRPARLGDDSGMSEAGPSSSPLTVHSPTTSTTGLIGDTQVSGELQHARGMRRVVGRARRHVEWARQQGVSRLVEEDQLNPMARAAGAYQRRRWRAASGREPGQARPVFVVGVQRSGTNMVVRGFEASPAFEVHNENSRRAFERFLLRDDEQIRRLVVESRHEFVMLKPLCDSHRIGSLVDGLGTPLPGRIIWVYRAPDNRVRSAVTKFGDANRRALQAVAAGAETHQWQGARLSEASREFLERVDWSSANAATGAAAFWCIRNAHYFDQGLHERDDVTLVSYEQLAREPEPHMRALCQFLGLAYSPGLISHIDQRASVVKAVPDIDPVVRRQCEELEARLGAALKQKAGNAAA